MKILKIAYGKGRNAAKWFNDTITWEELGEKLKTTRRTDDTVEEYKAMSRSERQEKKDIGGFVGGHLKNGRRLVENVECRSFLSLDGDKLMPGFIDSFEKNCKYAAAIYTTHGHTPEAPRARIIIPLKEDITPDCYIAVARYYAAELGIDQFDVCSYKVNQLMFWPTTPADGEYICKVIDGPFMDATAYLDAHPGWQDCSSLPTASYEKELRENSGKKQEDPLLKTGVVGAFCRTYSIQEAIGKFLTDVYAPSVIEGRYDYIPGKGSAGVVIYEDKFALYSMLSRFSFSYQLTGKLPVSSGSFPDFSDTCLVTILLADSRETSSATVSDVMLFNTIIFHDVIIP